MDIETRRMTDQASVIRRQWKRMDEIQPYKCVTGDGLPRRFADEDEALKFFHRWPGRCLVSHYMPDGSTRFVAYKYR